MAKFRGLDLPSSSWRVIRGSSSDKQGPFSVHLVPTKKYSRINSLYPLSFHNQEAFLFVLISIFSKGQSGGKSPRTPGLREPYRKDARPS